MSLYDSDIDFVILCHCVCFSKCFCCRQEDEGTCRINPLPTIAVYVKGGLKLISSENEVTYFIKHPQRII